MPAPLNGHHTAHEPLTIIGPDTFIKGEMTFGSGAKILGKFEGRIITQGRVEIGEGAECKATIEAGTIIVDGLVEGDIIAHERLELNAGAVIKGDLAAAKLVAAEGATITGHCSVGAEAVRAAGSQVAQEAPSRPKVSHKPSLTHTTTASSGDLDNALAGLESKLAGFTRARAITGGEH